MLLIHITCMKVYLYLFNDFYYFCEIQIISIHPSLLKYHFCKKFNIFKIIWLHNKTHVHTPYNKKSINRWCFDN
jgi:hypothetical protein